VHASTKDQFPNVLRQVKQSPCLGFLIHTGNRIRRSKVKLGVKLLQKAQKLAATQVQQLLDIIAFDVNMILGFRLYAITFSAPRPGFIPMVQAFVWSVGIINHRASKVNAPLLQ